MEIEKAIGDLLRKNRMTLSAAESCTGGLVCDRITNVSGSSAYFEGGIVSYTIKAKAKHLGIPAKYIERYGVVSPQVAKRMAEGVRRAFRTTFGLSTTGVAGPAGGTRKTPVGTVFIALSDENGTRVEKLFLKGTRRKIKEAAAEKCLQLLYDRFVPVPGTQGAGSQRAATGDISNRIEELRQSKKSKIVLIRKTSQGILDGKERLGIFPASFNPPTLAHLALVKEAGGQGKLDEILLLLDIRAMDKKPVEAEFGDRLRMLKKVFGRDPKISIGLSNHGLFLDKIEPLRDVYPDPIEFFFIVGFDTIVRVMDGKYYRNRKRSLDKLFARCHFLVANRGEQEQRAFELIFRKRENKRYIDKVSFFTLPEEFSSVSSTMVRKRVAKNQPVDRFVPPPILPFIVKKGLYRKVRP